MESWHEYYRDENKIEVLIKFTFKIPAMVNNFNIDDGPLHTRQNSNEIDVSYHKHITVSLYNDLDTAFQSFVDKKTMPQDILLRNPSQYIVGYLGEVIERVNKEILDRKYKEGSILLRTISQFDIYNVFIVNKDKGKFISILWPLPIPQHPEIINNYREGYALIFVRDLMDAMTEYFYFNYDECIRKVITSLENYFINYDLQPPEINNFWSRFKIFKKTKFKKTVNVFISEPYYVYKERDLRILRNNIHSVYRARNAIVHNKLRVSTSNGMFCKKAIGTLLYVYQSKFITDDNKFQYIFSFYMQFQSIADMIIGLNLDNFAKSESKSNGEGVMINSDDDLNKAIFSDLKITSQEIKQIGL